MDRPAQGAPASPSSGQGGRRVLENLLYGYIPLAAALTLPVLALAMAGAMFWASIPAMKTFGWGFLFNSEWDPVREQYGALPFIYGTLLSSFLALFLAVPLGVGAALYLAELSPQWLRPPVSFMIELLAAVPSVIYGLWGIFFLAPWMRNWVQPALSACCGFLPLFQGPPYGIGMLSAGIILAIMIVPYITSVSREVFLAVPNTQREAALGLGATQWETIRLAVLGYARSGLVGAVLLGLGRALGETMAVTMVIGNRPEISLSLFAPGYTMASVLANEFTEATTDIYVSALVEIALLLLAVTIAVNILARLLVWSVSRSRGARE